MQRRLLDAEREMISNFLKSHMTLQDCGLAASPLLAIKMLMHNTTDGLPYVDPPLTDEDAQKRVLVMVRNGEMEPWLGPGTLAFCLDCTPQYIVVWPQKDWSRKGVYGCWRIARRATPEEIAAVGLEVTQ